MQATSNKGPKPRRASMRPIRHILVAVKDLTARSFPAVDKAIQLARALDARLELFHGLDFPVYADSSSEADRIHSPTLRGFRDACLARLETIAARARGDGVTVTVSAEWDFPAYEAVLRHAARTGADLIVAQCHAGRRFAPSLLRLTDWELIRHSPLPVLLVKNSLPYQRPAILATVDPTHAFAKPPGLDQRILDLGRTVQRALRGTLHVLHAYIPAMPSVAAPGLLAIPIQPEVRQAAEKEARAKLAALLRNAGVPRSRQHLAPQAPQDAIPGTALQTRSAIVVMGSISRSGLKRAFIGNTAERVLDELSCDVLIVKPEKFRSQVPRRKRGLRLMPPMPF